MSFIAIDLGTSFIKGAVLDTDLLAIQRIQRVPFPDPLPGLPAGWVETDPMEIVSAVRTLIGSLMAHAPDCSGLVMCSQMGSLVLTDLESRPLSNCIGWRDHRVLQSHPSRKGSYFDLLSEKIGSAERHEMGNEFRPGLPLSFLFCLSEEGRLPREAVVPASLGDFVLANLCDSFPNTDATNASALGLLNLATMDWHWPVISRLGLETLRWPEVLAAGEVAGYLKMGGRAIPCYIAVGDQQAALAGTLVEEGELWLNISTGSQVSLLTPKLEAGDYCVRPSIDGQYYRTITHVPAGRSLAVLVDLLSELARAEGLSLHDPWSYIAKASEQVETTDLRVDLAFFEGPCGDRGEIGNIREGNLTVGNLFRAAFQNMADNYHACALSLSPDRGWRRLVFSGGLPQRVALLRNLIARRFGMEYRLPASQEDTLLGLMSMALVCSGAAPSMRESAAMLREGYGEAAS